MWFRSISILVNINFAHKHSSSISYKWINNGRPSPSLPTLTYTDSYFQRYFKASALLLCHFIEMIKPLPRFYPPSGRRIDTRTRSGQRFAILGLWHFRVALLQLARHICARPTLRYPIKGPRRPGRKAIHGLGKEFTRYALENVWPQQKIAKPWPRRCPATVFSCSSHERFADCRHTRASRNTGGRTMLFTISSCACRFKYNARCTHGKLGTLCLGVNSCTDDIVTLPGKVRMMNWRRRTTVVLCDTIVSRRLDRSSRWTSRGTSVEVRIPWMLQLERVFDRVSGKLFIILPTLSLRYICG